MLRHKYYKILDPTITILLTISKKKYNTITILGKGKQYVEVCIQAAYIISELTCGRSLSHFP